MIMRSPLLVSTILPLSVHGFIVVSLHHSQHLQSNPRNRSTSSPLTALKILDLGQLHKTRLSSSGNDEEIAALEEKLRQLKENTVTEQNADVDEISLTEQPDIVTEGFEEKRFKINDDSSNVMVTGEAAPSRGTREPYEELLSEQWKTRAKDSKGGGIDLKDIIVKGAAVVAILVGIIAFSQVPIGQEDLDKYSTAKPSTAIDLGDLNPVGENQQSSY